MAKLRYSKAVGDDLKGITKYISRDKPEAARRWIQKIRRKCRLIAKHPEIGDSRPEFGDGMRSTYIGHYVIYFEQIGDYVEIARVIRGDRDTKSL